MKRFVFWCLLVTLSFAAIGCNLFGWSAKPSSAGDYLNEGRRKLNDGDFNGALDDFRNAVREDPNSSEARYSAAKARLLTSGINSLDVLTTLSRLDIQGTQITVPFFLTDNNNWPNPRANSLYQALDEVIYMLKPIFQGTTSGSIHKRDIALDYGISQIVTGLMQFRDNNRDKSINDLDVRIRIIANLGSFNIDSIFALYRSGGAAGVNGLIDDSGELADILVDVLDNILGGDTTGYSAGNLKKNAQELKNSLAQYKIADGVDNDHDGYIDAAILGMEGVKFYFGSNIHDIRSVSGVTQGHDAAGSVIDSLNGRPLRPWTIAWVDTMRVRRPGYIDTLFAHRPGGSK